jgi:SAM-dependent methyltransferase
VSLPPEYFDDLYSGSADPWGFRTRWYEQRKRAATLAALPQERYRRAFEPGCSIGTLTAPLARRCDALLAADTSEAALRQARAAVADSPHVDVRRMRVPDEWPDGGFDLVVLSELGYYLDAAALHLLAERTVASLADGGAVLACHWRHPVADYPFTGDDVHALLGRQPGLHPVVEHVEEDFRLQVWTRGAVDSVARLEGLV